MADRVIDLLVKLKDDASPGMRKMSKEIIAETKLMGKALLQMAVDAAPLEGIDAAFRGITESSGQSADAMLDALKRGSAGMVAQRDLMATYNDAAQLVSVTFANQLPEAMGYLSKVAAATGDDMDFMLDSLVKGVGRLSPMILDNLKIQVSLADATEQASQMYGLQAGELSKAQVQAGMMAVTLDKLRENTAAMPDVMGTAAQQLGEFRATMTDLRDEVGTMALPVLKALLDVINNLEPATLALALGLGSAATAAMKFGGGLSGLAGSLKTTRMGLVAGAAAVGALIGVYEAYTDVQRKVAEGEAAVQETIASWTDEARQMVSEGKEAADVTLELANRINTASDEFKKGGIAVDLFVDQGKEMRQMAAETNDVLVTTTGTYKEYIAQVKLFNANSEDSAAKIHLATEETVGLAGALAEVTPASLQASTSVNALTEQQYKLIQAGDLLSAEVRELNQIDRERAETIERQAHATRAAIGVAHERVLSLDDLGQAEEQAAGVSERAARAAEIAARAAETQAGWEQQVAERMRASAAAADEEARAQASLAQQIMGKTDAQIADTLASMVDPAAMGIEAYTALTLELGLIDEKSAALAGALPELAAAIEGGIVPTENADEALAALVADAEDGEVQVGALLDQFAKAPGLIGPSAEKLHNLNERLGVTETAGLSASSGVNGFNTSVGSAIGPVAQLRAEVERLNSAMNATGSSGYSAPTTSSTPAFQFGGVMPGYPWQTGLAILHGGEEVIPHNRRGGSQGVTLIIQGPLVESAVIRDERDVERLAELVADELAARVALRGAWG
jgi:hypothetical protein